MAKALMGHMANDHHLHLHALHSQIASLRARVRVLENELADARAGTIAAPAAESVVPLETELSALVDAERFVAAENATRAPLLSRS